MLGKKDTTFQTQGLANTVNIFRFKLWSYLTPYCLAFIHIDLIRQVRDIWADKTASGLLIHSAECSCYLFPPGVPGSSRAQHGHCHLCGASPHSWRVAAVLLPLSDALCALWDRDRDAKSKWAREKDPIVEQRKTKYNRDRERQGERVKIEIGDSQKRSFRLHTDKKAPAGITL